MMENPTQLVDLSKMPAVIPSRTPRFAPFLAFCSVSFLHLVLFCDPLFQGFCCSCSLAEKLGIDDEYTRANLDCSILSTASSLSFNASISCLIFFLFLCAFSVVVLQTSSAHCLEMGELWYMGFEPSPPESYYLITIQLWKADGSYEHVVLSPSVTGAAAVEGKMVARLIGDFARTITLPTFEDKYLLTPHIPLENSRVQVRLGFRHLHGFLLFILTHPILLLAFSSWHPVPFSFSFRFSRPFPPAIITSTIYLTRLCFASCAVVCYRQEGVNAWMLVDREMFTLDGTECNKIGVSYNAFRYETDRCIKHVGSCLHNQVRLVESFIHSLLFSLHVLALFFFLLCLP